VQLHPCKWAHWVRRTQGTRPRLTVNSTEVPQLLNHGCDPDLHPRKMKSRRLWHVVACLLSDSSDVALLYNDKAVLENHHASATFRLVRDDSHNILLSLSKDDYKYVTLTFCTQQFNALTLLVGHHVRQPTVLNTVLVNFIHQVN